MQVVVNSLLIHYTDTGKGPAVLLLHGWADRLETFKGLQADLSADYRVIALDLPGFGQSQPPAEPWDLDGYAMLVANFLKKIDAADEIMAVVGHSNGGAVAIRGLANNVLQAQKLVLLASAGVRDGHSARRFVIKVVAKVGKATTFWLPRSVRARLQNKLYGTVGSDMLVTPALIETFKRTVRQDIQADAKKLQLPTLLIYGKQDTATPITDVGEPLHAAIEHSRLEIVPEAGHFVHHDQAETVAKLVKEFLAS